MQYIYQKTVLHEMFSMYLEVLKTIIQHNSDLKNQEFFALIIGNII